ncbi:MAG: type II secretion system F family protein [Polyangiales bacterium]
MNARLLAAFLSIPPAISKWGGLVLIVLAATLATGAVAGDPNGLTARYWNRYETFLGRKLRRMFIFTPPRRITLCQVGGVAIVIGVHALVDLPAWWLFVAAVVVLPAVYIEDMRQKRIAAIEEQLDGFILALANALKATPSIGDAFRSIQTIVPDPLRHEIELAVKEMRVGSTLDQALLMMASRVGSRQLDAALSAILVGRQVGGNLPKILETTAGSLREMRRLEGVVRTRTAEGKMQLWVLGVFPFILMFALNAVSPGYFEPLKESFAGYAVVFLASLFWIASLVVARNILDVDL